MNTIRLLLVALGALLGFGLALLVLTPAPAPLRIPARVLPPPPPDAAARAPALLETHPPTETSPIAGSEAETQAPLPAAAAIRIQQLVESFRERAQGDFDNAEARARSQVRGELAKEQAAREDLARGGTMAYLRGLKSDFSAPWVMLASDEVFGALFERKSAGREIEGNALSGKSRLEEGDTIRYGPGQFKLPVRALLNHRILPKDLLFVGAGMDETLLVLDSELRPKGDVHSLTFRDLTLHCNDDYLEAMRDGPYTLRLERCRVIGFDTGAGGSCILGGRVCAFFATDCRIEAGYGRSPGSGSLFDVRGALLARLVGCTLVGPFSSVYARGSRAAHVFERCHLTRLRRSDRDRMRAHSKKTVQFSGCTFDAMTPEEEMEFRSRTRLSVRDINPAWRDPS